MLPRRDRLKHRGILVAAALLGGLLFVGLAGADEGPLPPPRVVRRSSGARPSMQRPTPVPQRSRPRPVRPVVAPRASPVPPPPPPPRWEHSQDVRPRRGRAPRPTQPRAVPIPPQPPAAGRLPPPVVRRRGSGGPTRSRPVPPGPRRGPRPPPSPGVGPEAIPFVGGGRPEGADEVEPGDFLFETAPRPLGGIRRVTDPSDPKGVGTIVFLGTPHMRRTAFVEDGSPVEALSIKANTIVAWVDLEEAFKAGSLGQFGDGAPVPDAATGAGPSSASIIPKALLGIYAEGAVEITFGTISFAAERLYIEPHTYKMMLMGARVSGRSIGIGALDDPISLHIRAPRVRMVSKGLMVFDDAEVSTSRSDDRIVLQLKQLTAEELKDAVDEDGVVRSEILGFYADSSQWYSGRTLTLRAERLPLLMLPRIDFGFSEKTDAIASPIKSIDFGNKSEVGRFGFLRVGFPIGPRPDPWFDLFLEAGGYTDRGPAGGVDLKWDHTRAGDPIRSKGQIETWGVYDNKTLDSDGFQSPDDFRFRVLTESKTWFGDAFQVDHELHVFSDRGFNNEFFERDDLSHKDRESYVRARWQPRRPGYLVATLEGTWHQRDFVTETTQLPEVGVWLMPVPLLRPGRRGGLSIDLTTETRAGYLGRAFDVDLPDEDYEAWRLHTDTLVNAGIDAGDVRLSGHLGASGSVYTGRTDAGSDLERAALLAGVRANLQSWRVFRANGGLFRLNGLRHVVDMDGGVAARLFDSHEAADVPFFDLHESERERTSLAGRYRNRLQTRRNPKAKEIKTQESGAPVDSALRTVADLDLVFRYFLDDKGPFGRETSGDLQARFYGEVIPGFEISSESDIDFDDGLQTASLGAGLRTTLRDRPFTLFSGFRYVKDRSTSLSAETSWRFSDRYAVVARGVVDFNEGEDLLRVYFRRYSEDHVIIFGFNMRNGEDFGVELSFEPVIGGRASGDRNVFRDQPDQNLWGAFPR